VRLDQLEVVLALAEELHFGRTARRLHISQSRVSKLVAALEREVGGALFDRASRRVRLTPLGGRFVERVGAAYRDLVSAVDEVGPAGSDATADRRGSYHRRRGAGPARSRALLR